MDWKQIKKKWRADLAIEKKIICTDGEIEL